MSLVGLTWNVQPVPPRIYAEAVHGRPARATAAPAVLEAEELSEA
jgi:hypothetical protein